MSMRQKMMILASGALLVLSFLFQFGPGLPLRHAAAREGERLHVEGRLLKDAAGRVVELRGINFEMNNWAYETSDYDAITGNWSYREPEASLDSAMRSMARWQFTPEDFCQVRTWGANMVRLQVPHYLFDSIGSPSYTKELGYELLDQWLSWADNFDLYVVLDLHVPHGGRQYYSGIRDEGKTFWRDARQQARFRDLWESLAKRYKDHPRVLFQLMNEPYPERAGYKADAWWDLAQTLINDIRETGATNIIIVSSPLGEDTEFKLRTDPLPEANLMYDFHFYRPYEFTLQEAWWITTPPLPSVSYPTQAREYAGWSDPPNRENGGNYAGSSDWQTWSETIAIDSKCPASLLVSPAFNSWNNNGSLFFDNCRLFIDGIEKPVYNHDLELGGTSGGNLPEGWNEWKSSSSLESVKWLENAGNHYLEIPATPAKASHSLSLGGSHAISVPDHSTSVTVAATVRGSNTAASTIFGANWYALFNQCWMRVALEPFLTFGAKYNVPIMCLEFGVIMKATPEEGHVIWLDDLGEILHEHGVHFAYHEYRGFSTESAKASFGVYQCWDKPAQQCPAHYDFVIPALERLFAASGTILPCNSSTLAASFSGSGLWVYNPSSATWRQASEVDPDDMKYSGSTLYVDFGASGIWALNGAAWSQLTGADPEAMVVSGSTLYADFGASGIWAWNGAAWSQLTGVDPKAMVVSGLMLYADFEAGGIWAWNGAAWSQLTDVDPETLVVSGSTLYADFGGSGIWAWNGVAWGQLTGVNPETMVVSGSTLYADFKASGIWTWNGAAWSQLTGVDPETMAVSGSTLYVDFGGPGIWAWNGATWSQLTGVDPETMVVSGSTLYADFGGSGIWTWSGTAWSQLTGANPIKMAASN